MKYAYFIDPEQVPGYNISVFVLSQTFLVNIRSETWSFVFLLVARVPFGSGYPHFLNQSHNCEHGQDPTEVIICKT